MLSDVRVLNIGLLLYICFELSLQSEPLSCRSNPCKNGATCTDLDSGGYYCSCTDRWGGQNCTEEALTCTHQPCLHGGYCTDLPNRQYRCDCKPGFVGRICEHPDPCIQKPCHPRAKCISNNLGLRRCECPPGFEGDDCSIESNMCTMGERSPCEHDGQCISTAGSFYCICRPGFTGTRCEVLASPCEPNPCKNHGLCTAGDEDFKCQCAKGYEGRLCETDINECSGSPCQNNGQCEDLIGGFRCHCVRGWKGDFCELRELPCDSQPCLNNGTCEHRSTSYGDVPNDYFCRCPPGFAGRRCETDLDDCVNVECQNGGTCVDGIDSWQCSCPSGFSGRFCEHRQLDDCSAAPNAPGCKSTITTLLGREEEEERKKSCIFGKVCLNGGVCVRPAADGQPFCDCPLGWTGETCNVPICSTDVCANKGICHAVLLPGGTNGSQISRQTFRCECSDGFTGDRCQEEIQKCGAKPCSNGGICLKTTSPVCKCAPGFDGEFCENAVPSCDSGLCLNGGKCDFSNASSPTCACPPGFLGARCETRATCADLNCGEHGVCREDSDGIAHCTCSDGWHGPTCELSAMGSAAANSQTVFPNPSQDGLSCADAPCQHGALCVSEVDETGERPVLGFRCRCETAFGNYTGPRCDVDVDECLSNPCLNGAACVNTPGSFVCKCLPGFAGDSCGMPVDPCTGRICANGGVCKVINGKPTCECPTGFEGVHCESEVNECSANPCQNGGTCFAFMGSHICKCPQGTLGPNCEHIVQCDSADCSTTSCRDEDCLNGGKCSSVQHNSVCECPRGFYGRNCEASINLCHQLLRSDLTSSGRPQLVASESSLPLMAATAVMATQLSSGSPHFGDKDLLSALLVSKTQLGPCYPDGTVECIPGGDNFTCACHNGFQGRYCEKRRDFCAEIEKKTGGALCLNGGVCRNMQVQHDMKSIQAEPFECICPPGFSGPRCEQAVPACDPSPCVNGGRCVIVRTTDSPSGTTNNKIQCICPEGLGGASCEVDTFDECSAVGTCLNGGRCIDGPGNFTCECADGFCGQRCELTGFVCTLEAINSPVKWPGTAVERSFCKLAKCAEKAGNGVCDRECDHLACDFDAGECLFPVLAREEEDPLSSVEQSGEDVPQPKLARPWSECASISELGVPCHLRFGDGKCDPACDAETCLFDGWDCLNNSAKEVTPKHHEPVAASSDSVAHSGTEGPVHFSGNLLILLDIAPDLLRNKSAHFENTSFEHELLTGLMRLLRSRLRIKRQPSTGEPMIYPVNLKAKIPSDKGLTAEEEENEGGGAWDVPSALTPPLNLSITDLVSAQSSVRESLQQFLLQLATISTSTTALRRVRRSVSGGAQVRVGSRVFLELENKGCDKSDSCFHDVETAAQFLSASIRRRRYAPPVGQILSVETAPQSTVDFFLSSTGDGNGPTGPRSTDGRLWGMRATIIYCFIGLLCTLCLTCLLGVLYGLVQRRAQVSASASSEACILGTGYAQKSLIKKLFTVLRHLPSDFSYTLHVRLDPNCPPDATPPQSPTIVADDAHRLLYDMVEQERRSIRTTGIWYPGHHNREGRNPVFVLSGAMEDIPSNLQGRCRATTAANLRSSFPPWRLETALRFGRLRSRRARIPPCRETETTQCTDQMSLHPPSSPLPPPPSTCEDAATGFLSFDLHHHLAEAQRTYPQGGLVSSEDCSSQRLDLACSTLPLMTSAPSITSEVIPTVRAHFDPNSYFADLVEDLISTDGLGEPLSGLTSSKNFIQKLEFLRRMDSGALQQARYSPRTGSRPLESDYQSSLLAHLVSMTLPETGESLLHLAARHNRASVVPALLCAGADPFCVDHSGRTVLLTAVSASALQVVRILLNSPYITDLSRMFVQCPTEDRTTVLIQAVKMGDSEMVEVLLQTMTYLLAESTMAAGMGVIPQGGSAYPSSQFPVTSVSNDLRRPMDPTQQLQARTNFPRFDRPGCPRECCDLPSASTSSANSFGLNVTDCEGRTALHWAAATEQPAIVHLLLSAGASHDIQTNQEETALTLGAREGSTEVCHLLLSAGANPEIADHLDRTPRQIAVQNGHTPVVQLLNAFSSVNLAAAAAASTATSTGGVHHFAGQSDRGRREPSFPFGGPHPNPVGAYPQSSERGFFQPETSHYCHQHSNQVGASFPPLNSGGFYAEFYRESRPGKRRHHLNPSQSELPSAIYSPTGQSADVQPTRTWFMKTEETDATCSGAGESFLMQIPPPPQQLPFVPSTTEQSFFDGPTYPSADACIDCYSHTLPPRPLTQKLLTTDEKKDQSDQFLSASQPAGSIDLNSPHYGGSCSRPTGVNQFTPSSDTESPAHWSSPSPTAAAVPASVSPSLMATAGAALPLSTTPHQLNDSAVRSVCSSQTIQQSLMSPYVDVPSGTPSTTASATLNTCNQSNLKATPAAVKASAAAPFSKSQAITSNRQHSPRVAHCPPLPYYVRAADECLKLEPRVF